MRYRISTLLLLCALVLPLAAPSATKKSAPFPLTIKVVFTTAYDDNILNYSTLDRQRFETNSEPNPSEITTTDDWINAFGLRLYRDFVLGRRIKFRPHYSGKISLYAVNQIKNYQSHNFLARFAFRNQAYLFLKYYYLPSFYLRIYKDRDWNAYRGVQFDLSRPSVSLRLRLLAYELEGELGRENVYYDSFFTEYDSQASFWGLEASSRLRKILDISVGYKFKSSDNVGFDAAKQIAEADPSVDTEYGDASYEEDEYSIDFTYLLPLPSAWDWSLSLSLQRSWRYYQSSLSLQQDPFHAGRRDRRDRIEPALSLSPTSTLTLEGRFAYDRRRTTSPNPAVSRVKNFDARSFEFSVIYRVF